MKRLIMLVIGLVMVFGSAFAQEPSGKVATSAKDEPVKAEKSDSKSASKGTAKSTVKSKNRTPAKKWYGQDSRTYKQNQVIIDQNNRILALAEENKKSDIEQRGVLARIDSNLLSFWKSSGAFFQEFSRGYGSLSETLGYMYLYVWFMFYGIITFIILYAVYRLGQIVIVRRYERGAERQRGGLNLDEA